MRTAPSIKKRHLAEKRPKKKSFVIVLEIIFSLTVAVAFQERASTQTRPVRQGEIWCKDDLLYILKSNRHERAEEVGGLCHEGPVAECAVGSFFIVRILMWMLS